MTIYRHEPTTCPVCSYILDAAAPAGGSQGEPREGDITVCFQCTAFLAYAAPGVRLLTDAEIAGLEDETRLELQRARRDIKAFHQHMRNS